MRTGKEDWKLPRRNSLVRCELSHMEVSFRVAYPFQHGEIYVFLGEIPNMEGHCVIADPRSGRVYSGYHSENFIELANGEV